MRVRTGRFPSVIVLKDRQIKCKVTSCPENENMSPLQSKGPSNLGLHELESNLSCSVQRVRVLRDITSFVCRNHFCHLWYCRWYTRSICALSLRALGRGSCNLGIRNYFYANSPNREGAASCSGHIWSNEILEDSYFSFSRVNFYFLSLANIECGVLWDRQIA